MSRYRIITGLDTKGDKCFYVQKRSLSLKLMCHGWYQVDTWEYLTLAYPKDSFGRDIKAATHFKPLQAAEDAIQKLVMAEPFRSEVVGEYDLSSFRQRDTDTQEVQA